jgi:ankyrin repeat protein
MREEDNEGRTVLMAAVSKSDAEAISRFMEAGANVNAEDNAGRTALTLATDPKVISLLEQYGAK